MSAWGWRRCWPTPGPPWGGPTPSTPTSPPAPLPRALRLLMQRQTSLRPRLMPPLALLLLLLLGWGARKKQPRPIATPLPPTMPLPSLAGGGAARAAGWEAAAATGQRQQRGGTRSLALLPLKAPTPLTARTCSARSSRQTWRCRWVGGWVVQWVDGAVGGWVGGPAHHLVVRVCRCVCGGGLRAASGAPLAPTRQPTHLTPHHPDHPHPPLPHTDLCPRGGAGVSGGGWG